VLEALACGLPVLTYKSFSTESEFEDYLNILPTLDPEDIAKTTKGVLERSKKVDLGRFRGKYSWEAIVDKIDEIYFEIK
jgi:glycosyltransferase involved in cell wall biosynthesis